jgi:4'-phosphopantetheinyl transferase EntD
MRTTVCVRRSCRASTRRPRPAIDRLEHDRRDPAERGRVRGVVRRRAGSRAVPGGAAADRGAVPRRRAEFTTGRACARRALAELGVAPAAILSGDRREPLWPDGVVGAITHCAGFRAAAVGRATDYRSIGIDAEPDEPLVDGILELVSLPAERDQLRRAASARRPLGGSARKMQVADG